MKKLELSWMQYFAWVDPDTPYLRLFRAIVEVAYVALGGDVVDQCLAAARRMDEDYQRGQVEAAALAEVPERHGVADKRARPVGHREGAGARRDCWKYEGGRRKRFEEACDTVRKLFRSVLGYDAILPHEPEDTPEHKPEDPEMVAKIQARAANLQHLRPPVPQRAPSPAPGGAPLDQDLARANVALRQHLREAGVRIDEMQRTIMALQRKIAAGVTPEESRRMAAFTQGEPHSQTAPGAAQDDRWLRLVMGPAEPTAQELAGYPEHEHETIRSMWRQVQQAETIGVSKDLMRRAVMGDRQAIQEVDQAVEQMYAAQA